ncbi:hypothetical protein [Prolixibacter bellariivorans]|uniref:hypothetical protein n=1 Tax=Prolixibacter bellariivorans TaxID=314319 RepID=UPI00055FB5B0|nr:hypothetical protein [Prolixibacter bellariivorans]
MKTNRRTFLSAAGLASGAFLLPSMKAGVPSIPQKTRVKLLSQPIHTGISKNPKFQLIPLLTRQPGWELKG